MQDGQQPANSEKPGYSIEEYKDTSDNLRHYGSIRFAQLTLYVALTTVFVAPLVNDPPSSPSVTEALIYVGGLLTTIIFWLIEESSSNYWNKLKEHAQAIEKAWAGKHLGERHQYTYVYENRFRWATAAVRFLFIGMGLFWIASLINLYFQVYR